MTSDKAHEGHRRVPWLTGDYKEYDRYCPKCGDVLSLIEYTGTSDYGPVRGERFQATFTYELCNHCGHKKYHLLPVELRGDNWMSTPLEAV
jgi:hypothetical protein